MRIKCPNSDIFLELPGDRTDMKFTCPACHKVHRVTVSITTPSDDPETSANTRSMTRSQPVLPKKYATGAYPPVVDIPIEANFVLLDRQERQAGVDLGAAAPQAAADPDLANRQTEIIRDREPSPTPSGEPESASWTETPPQAGVSDRLEPSPSPADDAPGPGGEKDKFNGRAYWDEVTKTYQKPVDHAHPREEADPSADEAETVVTPPSESVRRGATVRLKRKQRRSRLPAALVLILLAAAGFLGWQQYQYDEKYRAATDALRQADASWQKGDAPAARNHTAGAEAAYREAKDLPTAAALWKRALAWTGLAGASQPEADELEQRLRQNRERAKTMDAFARNLDGENVTQMAGVLRDVDSSNPPQFVLLSGAMQASVVDLALAKLRADDGVVPPESLAERALASRLILREHLAPEYAQRLDEAIDALVVGQKKRFVEEARREVAAIAASARDEDAGALARYLELEDRLKEAAFLDAPKSVPVLAMDDERDAVEQLSRLATDIHQARGEALAILSKPEEEELGIDSVLKRAEEDSAPHPAMATAAVALIEETRSRADDLLRLRSKVFSRVQSEIRRGRNYSGTRLAWMMLRVGFDDPDVKIDPAKFHFNTSRAGMAITFGGVPVVMEMNEADYENHIRATVDGYRFTAGWAPLFHKPLGWMVALAREMRTTGVPPQLFPEWELLEGPGAPLALSVPGVSSPAALGAIDATAERRHLFFEGKLLPVEDLPIAQDARKVVDHFREAATRLHDRVMAESTLSPSLRQALKPVLMGTYQKPDARDYFDSAFCRRLIEADYLETFIKPMPEGIGEDLASYRATLGKLEAGYDDFRVTLDDGRVLHAVARLDADILGAGKASDQDPETGETVQRYTWRVEEAEQTVFFSPLPSRFFYAFLLAEYYDGVHQSRPAGVPRRTEVWHAAFGKIASYQPGGETAEGDPELWNQAIAQDLSGRFDPGSGPAGWNFPMHVLLRDDQGDPVVLATPDGVVRTPDFNSIQDEAQRRRAQDNWLDSTAATLKTPGELGLIFHQFFRYCSDSPMPELPTLIGSHFGLSDTHQTVYQSLERRWVGRLIGDCDDLAEFFQVLTRRQGKLSHVMQLPGHAACGYVEKTADDNYRFIVLQTGPVMQFNASTLNEVVETAYRSFDRGEGISHMTTDAVPLLLRFANEETRTPFVLSARIYEDPDYAETMIQVQAYWHEHVYSAAIKVMEEMVREDQEIGNIKELGSLYERVGFYDKSAEMRYRELELVKDQPQAALSTLLEIVQLHFQEKNRDKAMEALGEMEKRMRRMIADDDAGEYFRAITFRNYWAIFLCRYGEPERAWDLVRFDVLMTKNQLGRIADPVLRTLVVIYERMCMIRDTGATMSPAFIKAMAEVRKELDSAFGRGYFKSDDAYNNIIVRYFILGRFAVSDAGRQEGLDRLLADGPYATQAKDHTRRSRSLTDEDWEWFRITPQLYLALGTEMLDRDEYPEFYNPEAARPLLEDVTRAVEKGTGLGSDISGSEDKVKADMTLSFLNRDLDAFRRCLEVVKEKDYSSIYDDAALVLGLQGGLIPLADFPDWIDVFREFFPGSQHYFKVVYRAIDKGNYDHALMMAEATARFFPEEELLRKEAEFVRSIIPDLKRRQAERAGEAPAAE